MPFWMKRAVEQLSILSKHFQRGRFAGYNGFDSGVNFVEQDDGWNGSVTADPFTGTVVPLDQNHPIIPENYLKACVCVCVCSFVLQIHYRVLQMLFSMATKQWKLLSHLALFTIHHWSMSASYQMCTKVQVTDWIPIHLSILNTISI